jgi:hypothetical protein
MAEDAQASLAAAPEIRASGPGLSAEALRRAYLGVLKLALCDLVGGQTTSVGAVSSHTVMARELRGEGRRLRAAGMDWPLHGLTMVGLRRLDDLQACVEHVVADGVPGDLIEAGSWRGGASMLMRATLDAHGEQRSVVVADSFQGFPASDVDEPVDHELLVAPLDDVRDAFARLGLDHGVEFVAGFFEATLPALADRTWALVRLDADTYEATRLALRVLYPGLAPGGVLIIDDYGSWGGCRRAVEEFRAEHGIREPLEQIDFTAWRWTRRSEEPLERAPLAQASRAVAARSPAAPAEPLHVSTAEELQLRDEVGQLRERLAAAEAELARLRRTPLHRAHDWLTQRLGKRNRP